METHEAYNIQSEKLKMNWDTIGSTFIKAKALNEDDGINQEVYDFLLEEWKSVYSSMVLHPIKKEVMDGFYFVQTKGFEKEQKIKEEATVFRVYYYLLDYFSLMIRPNVIHEYDVENYPEYNVLYNNANSDLFDMFAEIWEELDNANISDAGYLEDVDGFFYDTQLELLQTFLADCWIETKGQTQSTANAILSESTAADYDYWLDEKRRLDDSETAISERY